MLWIKRNLVLVVFGAIALGMLGWSVMFFLGKRAANKKFEEGLQAAQTQLDGLHAKNPFPSETNISVAKSELARVRQIINTAKQHFTPIPFEKVADKEFTALLQNTLFDLQRRAQQLGIELPEKDYAFSFKSQKNALTFAPGSFPTLPEQLAEIKAISDVIFEAKVNRVTRIKRMRVTVDDQAGSPDYHEYVTATNTATGTVANPYEFTVHSFSGDLAKVLEGLNKSTHGFIVKSVKVEPAPEAPKPVVPAPQPIQVPQPKPPGAAKPGGKGEILKTILNEKLLEATLLIEVIKPLK